MMGINSRNKQIHRDECDILLFVKCSVHSQSAQKLSHRDSLRSIPFGAQSTKNAVNNLFRNDEADEFLQYTKKHTQPDNGSNCFSISTPND